MLLVSGHAIATGDRVTVGQYLMDSASTGNSTGPHLHFEVRRFGRQIVRAGEHRPFEHLKPAACRADATTGSAASAASGASTARSWPNTT